MFCSQFRPIIGGAEKLTEELANALSLAGCQVQIVTLRRETNSPDIEEVDGVRVERLPLIDLSKRFPIRGIAFINIPYILWQMSMGINTRLKDVDIVHCQIAGLETLGIVIAARIKRIPLLVTAHTANWHSDLGQIKKTGFTGKIIAHVIPAMVKHWVAISAAVENELVEAGVPLKQIARIPNGVKLPTVVAKKSKKIRIKRFLCLGRLANTAERDVLTLLKAFDRLALEYDDVELALVGGGDLLEQTKHEAAQMKAFDRIYIPGFDNSSKWFIWADCFVLPSRYEGLSIALLEAMAEGLPCIANDIPANREVLEDGLVGMLVPVGNEVRLYEAMQKMMTDEAYADDMRYAALGRIHTHYGIDSVADRSIKLYEKIIMNFKK